MTNRQLYGGNVTNRQLYVIMEKECADILTELARLKQVFEPPVEASPGLKELYKRLVHIRATLAQERVIGPWPSPVAELLRDDDRKRQQATDAMHLADALNEMLGAYKDVYGQMPWERGD